jgi:uncharacterized protein DUF5050
MSSKFVSLLWRVAALSILVGGLSGCELKNTEPSWTKSKVLAAKLDHPQAIAVDGKYLYFILGGTVASQNEGTNNVMRMPIEGGTPAVVFKGGAKYIPDTFFLMLDEKYAYFSVGSLVRVPKDGGGPLEDISIAGMPTEFVMDNENYYWYPFVGEGMPPAPFYSIPKKGGTAQAITDPRPSANGLCIDDQFIYWIQTTGIYRKPKTGGEITQVYTTPNGQITSGLKLDAENFYFTQGTSKHALYKLSKGGGEPVLLAKSIDSAVDFVVGETDVYFQRERSMYTDFLSKVSKNGGEVIDLDYGYLRSLAVGKTDVYFTDVSNIYSIPK